jgi:hypothetical protein
MVNYGSHLLFFRDPAGSDASGNPVVVGPAASEKGRSKRARSRTSQGVKP